MKTSFAVFCAAIVSTVSFAQDQPKASTNRGTKQTEIMNLEKATWEAFKNKDADAFKKFLAPDYSGVYEEGIETGEGETAGMSTIEIRSYSLSDDKIAFPNVDVAVLTYKAVVEETSKGKDVSGTYNCASVWVKKGAKWLTVVHTEVKEVKAQ